MPLNSFSAQQYNEPFDPKSLRNWTWRTGNWCKNPNTRCGCTCFIADDRGFLIHPKFKNLCSSPWGDNNVWVWEQRSKCKCVDAVRNPQLYDRPECDIVVTSQKICPMAIAAATCAEMVPQLFKRNPKPVEVEQKILNLRGCPKAQSQKQSCDA